MAATAETSIQTEANSSNEFQEEITAKANSLRNQFRPYIEEKSLKKLTKNAKLADLANLKFKVTQKYLNLKNRTNITLSNLMNKVNNRSKFLDHYVPSNSFLFSKQNQNAAQSKRSAFGPALLQNNGGSFPLNAGSSAIRAISRENLDLLESKLNENELLLGQIAEYRSKLATINEILEEMEQVNQEVIIEEDQETVGKDEQMKLIEAEQNQKLEEINAKKEKIEADLEQCMELYRSLKLELNAVLHKRNFLKAKANEQKRIYADVSMKLKNQVENNRREMNEIQRKIIERRERDLAIIKAFRIRKIELSKCLEEKENLVKQNLNLSSLSVSTGNRLSTERAGELEAGEPQEDEPDAEEDDDDAAYSDYNLIEEFNPEMRVKAKYFKELNDNYKISRKDTIWKIKLNDGAHRLNSEQRLAEIEGVVFVDEEFKQLPDGESGRFEVGEGYFSTLYQGKSIMHKTNNKKLIIKKFDFEAATSAVKNEVLENGFKICAYLSKYPHKNIVEILGLFSIKRGAYYLVEEYCLSSLDQFVSESKDEVYLGDIKTIADGLANALFFLHGNGIAHQNVCPQSVQINERKLIKLGYLECAAICYSVKEGCFKNKLVQKAQILDKRFAAPEVLQFDEPIDPIKADVYSYGLILAYCYKRKPFADGKETTKISEAASSLIENCLNKSADSRYHMLDVVTHGFFQ